MINHLYIKFIAGGEFELYFDDEEQALESGQQIDYAINADDGWVTLTGHTSVGDETVATSRVYVDNIQYYTLS